MENEISFAKYRQHIEKIAYKKNQYNEKIEQLKIVRAKYGEYLKANPYKNEYHKLTNNVEVLKLELIDLIPNKWNTI